MKVIFSTNIDAYKGAFPTNFVSPNIPRKGDMVEIDRRNASKMVTKRLPLQLEVCQVTWNENFVEVELHYSELQAKMLQSREFNAYP